MTVRGEVDEAAWTSDMLYGTEPSVAPVVERLDTSGTDDVMVSRETASSAAEPVDLDAPDDPAEPEDVNAGSRKVGALVAAGVVAAVVVITTALIATGEDPPPGAAEHNPPTAPAVPAAAPTAPPPVQDQAVSYTASADCPPGSTSAQALTDTTTDSAWVCVRGSTEGRVDGQVLRIDFGRTHALSAVSVTPGWVAKTPGGKDEWLQHRVVSRLQYVFNDDDRTVFTQDTGNAHGPVTTPLPHPVLASRVTVTVLATARPPASPPVASPAGGFPESVLGEGGLPVGTGGETAASAPSVYGDEAADPVDATFAVSALTFFGHPPK
ncbi:hypothetical protein [Mycobacterium sp. GA-2829]|uniref:hypothetical protein n=1 Tax=Mycobacterium sp. GA-2829 TaxID=1772283 RepID=UPI0007400092|nr:hypothetical protein [Mycobacterium sp. GA-2829]KUI36191.1 hypothetical protein AU194_15855 [Mycobacterium sp. GA-2829]